jgi:hypothetical protein
MGSLVREDKHTGAAGENGMVAALGWHIISVYLLDSITAGNYATFSRHLVQAPKAAKMVGIVVRDEGAEV